MLRYLSLSFTLFTTDCLVWWPFGSASPALRAAGQGKRSQLLLRWGSSVVPAFPSSFCSVFLQHYWRVRVGSRASFFERGGLYSCGLFRDHSCFPLAAPLVVSRGAPGSWDCCWGGLPFLLC